MSAPKVGLKKITPEPGYKTLVRDDSAKGLPTDVDRERQTNLPPDAATPRAPQDPKTDGGGGGSTRVLPKYEENTPDNDIPDRPRSLPTPGEEYGHPTKFDYGYVTRRTMTAGDRTPGERCDRCHRDIVVGFSVPDEVWDQVVGDENQIRCVMCFDEEAQLKEVPYDFDDLYPVPWHDWDEDEAEQIKTAYKRQWRPGQFQHRQKGISRIKSRQKYRRNRNKYKMQAKLRYKRNKKNPQFRRQQQHRRKYPHMHKRRRASSILVASMYLAEMEQEMVLSVADRWLEAAGHDWNQPQSVPPRKRQKKQRGKDKMDSKKEYRGERVPHNREMKMRHKKLSPPDGQKDDRPKTKLQKYKQWYNAEYHRRGDKPFRRRADVLVTPQISFAIGADLVPGTIHSVSPMTGMVTFVVDAKDHEPLRSMPLGAFLQVVVFYSEDDIDAFFELVDVEIGPEAYEDIDEDVVRGCAAEFDVDVDSAEFQDECMDLVGESELSNMTPDQLEAVTYHLVVHTMEGGHGRTRIEDEDLDEGDPGEGEAYDWHLYYGEVPEPEVEPLPNGKVAEGITFTYEVENPKQEIDYPASGTNYQPTSPSHYRRDQGDDDERAPGHQMPDHEVDDVPAGSSRVVPPGDGQLSGIGFRPRTAATMDELARQTGPGVHQRARAVPVRLSRADPRRGIWTFQAKGSRGVYLVRVKGRRKGNVKNLGAAQVQVSCSCPFFRWQGPEHWAKAHKFLYGRPRGTASRPDIRDPEGKHWVCKHVLAALNMARKYRFGSEDHWVLVGAELVPEYAEIAVRVADRYLAGPR